MNWDEDEDFAFECLQGFGFPKDVANELMKQIATKLRARDAKRDASRMAVIEHIIQETPG